MPLTRGDIVGFDAEKMVYNFTMKDGGKIINCSISNAALLDLVGRDAAMRSLDRESQLASHRDIIEQIASKLFVARKKPPEQVRIFAKHVFATRP